MQCPNSNLEGIINKNTKTLIVPLIIQVISTKVFYNRSKLYKNQVDTKTHLPMYQYVIQHIYLFRKAK